MEISLSQFSYFFQAMGDSGGLASIKLSFTPSRIEGRQIDEIKATARNCIHRYARVLDSLYGDVIDGKKEPLVIDSPATMSTGYRYQGRFTKKSLRSLKQRLEEIFHEEPVAPRGELSLYENQEVTIQCSFGKNDTGFKNCTVEMSFHMDHLLNVCFFRFTKRLEEIRIEKAAHGDMEKLQNLLNSIADKKNVDYYTMLA